MRKQWLGVCAAAGLLAACSSNHDGQPQDYQTPQPAVCNGPVTEISGAEPRYEPPNPTANQDYERDGTSWKIVTDPDRFTQTGYAAIYDAEPDSNLTASGEPFDPTQLSAAHPTLPIPSYARITNLANGRMIVVRINDRGPYGNDRIISLSRAAADRLNTSNNTKVRIDPIIVAQDGSVSGPGTVCTTIARQTYALPARPDLGSSADSTASAPQAATAQGNVLAISNDTLQPVQSDDSGHTPATSAVDSDTTHSEPQQAAPLPENYGQYNSPVTAPGSEQGKVSTPDDSTSTQVINNTPAPAVGKNIVLQVGAVGNADRASALQQKLSQQFNVPGRVSHSGDIYRVQLGPFSNREQASALQQRLAREAQQQSFVTLAP